MGRAVNNRLLWKVALLLTLCAIASAHLHIFLNVCLHNDEMVACSPPCPKICMNLLHERRCTPQKCTPGCACKEGWVRQGSSSGKCIMRSSCKRWIL